jgi:hypothetical protein
MKKCNRKECLIYLSGLYPSSACDNCDDNIDISEDKEPAVQFLKDIFGMD